MACPQPTTTCPGGSASVDSAAAWNDTGFDVIAGQTYRYTAEGTWCDWFIQTDADGFERWYMAPLRSGRRVKDAPWFRLIGAVDRGAPVVLGKRGEFVAPASGRLYCFANDWPSARGNNKGRVCLRLSR
jgi:hypothetical protein